MVTYEINGYTYEFTQVKKNAGVDYGYSAKKRKWAWLFPTYIQFEGEGIVMAKRLS